jgi:hypothetical protein
VIPRNPKVAAAPTAVDSDMYDEDFGDPIGVAVNGVLIFHDHTKTLGSGETEITPVLRDFDACGGHSDKAHRYHYHAIPHCLLRDMGSWVPDDTTYMYGADSAAQVGPWPNASEPSPLLGFALDGFPIFGPYADCGTLKLGASAGADSNLDECNFDAKTQRYHLTPNAPFAPPCLVGDKGSYSDTIVPKRCPTTGIKNAFCFGEQCVLSPPVACTSVAWVTWLNVMYIVLLVITAAFLVHHHVIFYKQIEAAVTGTWYTPAFITIMSVVSSWILLLCYQPLMQAFYGKELDMDSIDKYLNDSAASYLSVAGLVYGLVIAQIFSQVQDRLLAIKMAIAEELSGIHRVALLVGGIATVDQATVKFKKEILDVLFAYVESIASAWGNDVVTVGSLHTLYTIVPLLARVCSNAGDYTVEVASRALDVTNEIAGARYQRVYLEKSKVAPLLWFFVHALSLAMFFGVLLIYSGSDGLGPTLNLIIIGLIGSSTYIIADMDAPYRGFLTVEYDPVLELLEDIQELSSDERLRAGFTAELNEAKEGAKVRKESCSALSIAQAAVIKLRRRSAEPKSNSSGSSPATNEYALAQTTRASPIVPIVNHREESKAASDESLTVVIGLDE